jgi:serine/threonine protein phosphatase PrpC
MLTDDEIHGVATFDGASLEKKTERLVELANNAGGDDNITVLTVEL